MNSEEEYKSTFGVEKKDFLSKDIQFFSEIYLNNYKNYILSESYLSGFIDGDGSISCSSKYPNYIKLEISQCNFLPIFIIAKKFNGNLCKKKNDYPKRNQYKISFSHNNALPVLHFIKDNLLLKKEQCKLAIENINILRNYKNKLILKENFDKITKLNKSHNDRVVPDNINWNYIAGLFDAEGYICLSKCQISITQKNSLSLLRIICNYIGCGCIRNSRFFIEKKINVLNFFVKINDKLIVKKQYSYFLHYLNQKRMKYVPTNDLYRLKYKHSFDIPIKILNHLKKKLIKNNYQNNFILREQLSNLKKGANNPNFGIARNKNHCRKISLSCFGKKRILSDENISKILELKDKDTQQNIANKFNVSRSTIYKIYSGKLVISSEYEKFQENKNIKDNKEWIKSFGYSEEESKIINGAITKRTIDGKYMALIWYYGKLRNLNQNYPLKINSTEIVKYISDKIKKQISIYCVKNIWNKKTKLYKFDFENYNFDWYNYINDSIDSSSEWIPIC